LGKIPKSKNPFAKECPMKKIFAITLACSTLAACSNGIPECNNRDLDGCGYGHAYTEERTYKSAPKVMAAPVVAPAPAPVPEPVFTPPPVAAPTPCSRAHPR
jgi:hypothetical protein